MSKPNDRATGRARILVVDDEESPRESLRFILKDQHQVVTSPDGQTALERIAKEKPFDVVLLDMKMPQMDGLEVLSRILQISPRTRVVIVTAVADAKPAVQAMKMGATDYLNKPFGVDEIRLVVERILLENEMARPRAESPGSYKFENIIGSSAVMQEVYALIQRLLGTDTTVLVQGETGTGKELIARALHYNSARKEGPFIAVHCASIPSELLESELFGHEKGAFTGALQRRIGMFEAANGGTLFLDEIGEMVLGTQSKLLRAIQEREIRRVGGRETIHIDVRIVCASNRDLQQQARKGAFREDLFYRINVVPIQLPPLRERQDDILQLILHFAQRFAKELNREIPQFTPEVLNLFVRYPWPGNVRELEHAVERILVTCDATKIGAEHLPFVISHASAPATLPAARSDTAEKKEPQESNLDLLKITEDVERKAIQEALQRAGGVMTKAAHALNITRRMLRYKMDKLGIPVQRQ